MTERLLAAEPAERDRGNGPTATAASLPQGMAATLLSLQRTAGNAAVGRLLTRPTLQRCSAGGCTCGGKCGGRGLAEEDELGLAPDTLRRAMAPGRMLARSNGGPYHPPVGTPLSCSMADSCSDISTRINYLRHTIRRHREWDQANPDPRWPGGRHAAEIADLERALANCTAIASVKCRGQPVVIPVPQERTETAQERAERVRRQLFEALPWAVAVAIVALVVACVIAEPCGLAVLAGAAAVGGTAAAAAVLAILIENGVVTDTEGAPTTA
jgi:hypothetical protein